MIVYHRHATRAGLAVYVGEYRKVGKIIREKRRKIEYELPRLVSSIDKTLIHSRDVLGILDSYREHAGEELRRELEITVADMRSGKDTLMPIVTKLTDVRIVNNEIKGMLSSARVEYYMMAGMVVGNIPLLYFLNKDWFNALMFTTLGKLVLAICGLVIIVTAVLMLRFTKQIEYRK